MSGNNFRRELLEQVRQLAFSSGADAAALAFGCAEGGAGAEALRGLDLSAVSSIHTMANGSVELKFIDRIKLIELLLAAEGEQKPTASDELVQALDRASRRLASGDRHEDGAQALERAPRGFGAAPYAGAESGDESE